MEFWNGDFAWATPKDFSSLNAPILLETERRLTREGVESISSGLLPIGSVLLSSRAPIGYLALAQIPVAINQGFIAMICDGALPNVFILNWARENMAAIHSRANGSTFQEISKANFRPLPIIVPPLPLIAEFDRQVTPLYKQITENLKQSRALSQLRDVLLPRLISGALRVPDAMHDKCTDALQ